MSFCPAISFLCCLHFVVIGGVRPLSSESSASKVGEAVYSDSAPANTNWIYRLPCTGTDFFRDLGGAERYFFGCATAKSFYENVGDRAGVFLSEHRTLQTQHVCLQV